MTIQKYHLHLIYKIIYLYDYFEKYILIIINLTFIKLIWIIKVEPKKDPKKAEVVKNKLHPQVVIPSLFVSPYLW